MSVFQTLFLCLCHVCLRSVQPWTFYLLDFICQTRLVDTGSLVECSSVLRVVQFTILSHMAFVCLSVCVSLLLFSFLLLFMDRRGLN